MKKNTSGALIAMAAAAAFALLPATAMADSSTDMSNMHTSSGTKAKNSCKGKKASGAKAKNSCKGKKASAAK